MWLVLAIIFAVSENKLQASLERSWPFNLLCQNLQHPHSIKQAGFSTELGRGHAWLPEQKTSEKTRCKQESRRGDGLFKTTLLEGWKLGFPCHVGSGKIGPGVVGCLESLVLSDNSPNSLFGSMVWNLAWQVYSGLVWSSLQEQSLAMASCKFILQLTDEVRRSQRSRWKLISRWWFEGAGRREEKDVFETLSQHCRIIRSPVCNRTPLKLGF